MKEYYEKNCPDCGQRLRFPKHVGGIVMACSSCGKRFHSDFKLGGVSRKESQGVHKAPGIVAVVFNLPLTILNYLRSFFFRG